MNLKIFLKKFLKIKNKMNKISNKLKKKKKRVQKLKKLKKYNLKRTNQFNYKLEMYQLCILIHSTKLKENLWIIYRAFNQKQSNLMK